MENINMQTVSQEVKEEKIENIFLHMNEFFNRYYTVITQNGEILKTFNMTMNYISNNRENDEVTLAQLVSICEDLQGFITRIEEKEEA